MEGRLEGRKTLDTVIYIVDYYYLCTYTFDADSLFKEFLSS